MTLMEILVDAHQSESTRYGLTFSDLHHVGADYFRCCWECRSSQFSQYESSGPATFLFSITNRNADIRKELYANVVWSVAPPFCAHDEGTDGLGSSRDELPSSCFVSVFGGSISCSLSTSQITRVFLILRDCHDFVSLSFFTKEEPTLGDA